MTPTEFTRLTADWPSLNQAAADLGITRQSAYRYRNGTRSIPEPVARLLRIVAAAKTIRTADCQPAEMDSVVYGFVDWVSGSYVVANDRQAE